MSTTEQLEAKYLSRLVKAAAALKELEAKVDALERERSEPIAIIGMGCRFPGGADSPERFWRLLDDEVDAVTEVPPERRSLDATGAPPERGAALWGAFVKDVDRFDAPFFGISPREAAKLDPQQRLLLEVAWEALEHAGAAPDRLARSRTGVFVGITTNDYQLLTHAAGPDEQDAYVATGNGHCFPPGRLSYFLGLEGPSLAVDTACSSSLVAIHLACQSLRARESTLALAGGVNLMLAQSTTQLVEELQALSADGRCKTFDAGANGFVRGEGCGLVVLKRLSDALADGDRILAVIRGSAVNQDGRSAGLTAPSLLAQQAMLRQAIENARISAADIGYVETHGTGTSLGDPIETDALVEVLGAPRDDGSVCALGALKTNIGHLEAAAGVAGLMKVVLAFQHEAIPANLHFKTLNPRIALEGTPFVIPTRKLPWPASPGARPRRAGVSSFGMSGTNAHVVLEEAPRREAAEPPREQRALALLPLSARTPKALVDLAQAYLEASPQAPQSDASLQEIAYTAGVRRSHHEHRLAVVAGSRDEVSESLRAFVSGEPRPQIVKGQAALGPRPKTVFVFSGQGSQWVGMGRELARGEPVFRSALEACDAFVKRHAGFSLLDELAAPEGISRLRETEVAQPAIFAVQTALSSLLASFGVTPDAVIGHSVGEVAAAHLAGALTLEEAVRLVVLRGRIMQRASGAGKMVSVALSAEDAAAALEGHEDQLALAAVNDPGSVVLSGEASALDRLVEQLRQRRVHCRFLNVNYAFHSPQMAPLAGELEGALGRMEPRRTSLPMYSTARGAKLTGAELHAGYWASSLRETVQLARAVEVAVADRHRIFVEIGAHPVLSGNLTQCLSDWKTNGSVIPTLRRGQDELRCLFTSLGALYTSGYALDFQRLHPHGARVVSLPSYPWQRQRHWLKSASDAHPAYPARGVRRDEPPVPALPSEPDPEVAAAWIERLRGLAPDARAAEIEAAVRADLAGVLLLPADSDIDTTRPVQELGLDSLMAVQLRHELSARTGQPLPATVVFDYPTVEELTRYLLDTVLASDGRRSAA